VPTRPEATPPKSTTPHPRRHLRPARPTPQRKQPPRPAREDYVKPGKRVHSPPHPRSTVLQPPTPEPAPALTVTAS
jgi:hypothetical protein